MKSIKQFSFIGLAITLVMNSCTMEKRIYSSGYHIDWHKGKNNFSNTEFTLKNKEHQSDPISLSLNEASTDQSNIVDKAPQSEVNTPFVASILASNDEAFVLESKKTVFHTQSKVDFKENVSSIIKVENHKRITNKANLVKQKAQKKSSSGGGGKSQIVALLLCIFLGYLGIHRFYLGYTGMGVLYLLTLGLFGIGWFIDLILLLIPNGLTPKGKTSYRD